jgi:hypothetical protein
VDEGVRLLSECRVKSSTEGSNPSLSAIVRYQQGPLTSTVVLVTILTQCREDNTGSSMAYYFKGYCIKTYGI